MILKDSLKTIAVSLIILSLVGVVYAWTEPTQIAPLGNVAPPISTDATGQIKLGLLGLGELNVANKIYLIKDANGDGKLGIGVIPDTNSPALSISSATDKILKLTRQGATQPTTFRQGTDGALVIENSGRDIMTIKDGNISTSNTLMANGGLVIKSLVSSDPASPADGEMWMRQDSEHTYNNGNSTPPYGNFCGVDSNNGYALDLKSIQHWFPESIVWDIHPTQGQEDIENGWIWGRFYRHGKNGSSPYSEFMKFQINSNGSFNDPSYGANYVYQWKLNCNTGKTSCNFDFYSSSPATTWAAESLICGWNTITFNPQNRYLSNLSLKIYKNGKVWKSVFTPQ